MDAIVKSYQEWSFRMHEGGDPDVLSPPFQEVPEGMENIVLFDTYRKFPRPTDYSYINLTLGMYNTQYSMFRSDEFVAAALVRQGMIPNAPFRPTYAVSTRLLQLYHNLRCRCPHLNVQPFVKGLLDMHGVRSMIVLKIRS